MIPGWIVDPLLPVAEVAHTTKRWLDAARLHGRYQRLLGKRYLLVRFEDLVSRPADELERVYQFLGVRFGPELLSDLVVVGSSYETERQGLPGVQAAAAVRWHAHVPRLVRIWFAVAFGRYLHRFGYEHRTRRVRPPRSSE